jgi:PIN domain nuclease of toxin-antitoxin system
VTRYVVDASAAVEYLLQTTLGLKIAESIEGAFLIAPASLRRKLQREALTIHVRELCSCMLSLTLGMVRAITEKKQTGVCPLCGYAVRVWRL